MSDRLSACDSIQYGGCTVAVGCSVGMHVVSACDPRRGAGETEAEFVLLGGDVTTRRASASEDGLRCHSSRRGLLLRSERSRTPLRCEFE